MLWQGSYAISEAGGDLDRFPIQLTHDEAADLLMGRLTSLDLLPTADSMLDNTKYETNEIAYFYYVETYDPWHTASSKSESVTGRFYINADTVEIYQVELMDDGQAKFPLLD